MYTQMHTCTVCVYGLACMSEGALIALMQTGG